MQITKIFYPQSRPDWRYWLEQNHLKEKEIWLGTYKKSSGKQTLLYQDAVDEALCFGWIDSIEKGIDEDRYALRFSPRRPKSNWTITNIKRFKELSSLGLVSEFGRKVFDESNTK